MGHGPLKQHLHWCAEHHSLSDFNEDGRANAMVGVLIHKAFTIIKISDMADVITKSEGSYLSDVLWSWPSHHRSYPDI